MNELQKYTNQLKTKTKFRLVENLISELPGSKNYKPILFFYQLRALSDNNCITEASAKINDMAASLGISRRNFYYQLNKCYKLKIIYKKYGNFFFKSSAAVCAALDIEYLGKYTWIKTNIKNLDCAFRKRVLKAAQTLQYKKVCEKINKTQSESLPAVEIEKLRVYLLNNFVENFKHNKEIINIGINPDIAISQLRIAKIFGATTQTAGLYWQRKLEKLKLITVYNRVIYSECYKTTSKLFGRVKFDQAKKQTYLQMINLMKFDI
jgi:hypothetical protein